MYYLFTFIILFICASVQAVHVENLRCEYLSDPLGIDVVTPRLSWIMTSDHRGDCQTAYQVIVASTPGLLAKNKGDVWDSGKTASSQSVHVAYQGKTLQAGTKYYWKLRIWDMHGKPSAWSSPASWSMGLLSQDDWSSARWIAFKDAGVWKNEWEAHKTVELGNNVFKPSSWPWLTGKDSSIFALYAMANPKYDPAPLFRKEFTASKKIRSAHLYICGLGYYEAFINGHRVGDHVLDPAWTNYEQRSMYSTYDVTDKINKGNNAIGVMLGRGQYNPLCNDIWGLYKSAWVDQPKLIALLRIEYADGTIATVATDKSWKTSGGPVIYDDTRHGELYDARLEQEGWKIESFNDSRWREASEVPWNTKLEAQMVPPIRCFTPVSPIKIFPKGAGITVYDIGENLAGWARVTVKGAAGSKVLVEYCETPSDKELVPNLTPWRFKFKVNDPHYATFYDKGVNVRQQNGYILNGKGEETFECHFSYKAFQFIRLTVDEGVAIRNVVAVPVHTDVEKNGEFTCSDPAVNQMQKNAVTSLLSNYHSIATDCPHREKQGWTADNFMSSQAAMYNFNMAAFYTKWLVDLAGTQGTTGSLCTVAPSTGYDLNTSTAWPAAIVLLSCDIYRFYADTRPMEENYQTMRRFAQSNLLRQVPGKPEIINEVLGDWLAPVMTLNDTVRNNTMAPPEGHTLYGTSSHYLVVKRLSEISHILGKENEARELEDWAKRIAVNFNIEFFDERTMTYHGDQPTGYRQAANIVPLEYGLVPPVNEKAVLDNLVYDIHSKGDRLGTGFLGTPALMEYLAVADPALAYKVATQENYPGWGHMIAQGANSMWEDWDGYASRNHTPFCLISGYFYKHLAGIQPDASLPGFKHIIIRPSLANNLHYVDAYHDSMYGRIKSSWKRTNDKLSLNITIPPNTTATIYVPAASKTDITESGQHIDLANGLAYERTESGYVVFKATSGKYSFLVDKL